MLTSPIKDSRPLVVACAVFWLRYASVLRERGTVTMFRDHGGNRGAVR